MSRVEENTELMESLPKRYTGSNDIIQTRIMMDMLAVLQDISISLATIADFYKEDQTCENCKHSYTDENDKIIFCDNCYDYSEWEGKK